jgi:hypothetical protein
MPDDEPPPVEEDLLEKMEALVDDLAARSDKDDVAARLDYVIGLLVLRGHLQPGHRRLIERVKRERGTVFLSFYPDKRAVETPPIDCASLLPLCKARCCTLAVALSAEDLAERRLAWDIYEPYRLARKKTTGYCQYARADGGCRCYEDRPATCRTYDCRDDRRVWLDWEKKIPAPMEIGAGPHVKPLGTWTDDEDADADENQSETPADDGGPR